jgi:hypothetical protein
MSHESNKVKHGERVQQKEKKLKRKVKIAKEHGFDRVVEKPHKYHKSSVFSCGNPRCVMCMNPRKAFQELTMQERRFDEGCYFDE